MGWLDTLKGSQDACDHPAPHEEREELVGKKNHTYKVVTTRCRHCRKVLGESQEKVL